MLVLIGLTSWKGIENIHEGFNTWTWISTGLVGLTLLVAALGMTPHAGGLTLSLTGKFFGVLLSVIVLGWMLKSAIEQKMKPATSCGNRGSSSSRSSRC